MATRIYLDGTSIKFEDGDITTGISLESIVKGSFVKNLHPIMAELPASNFAERVEVAGTNFPYTVLRFDPATDEYAYWRFKVPPAYQEGTLFITMHYKTSVNSGDIKFGLRYMGIAEGETYDVNLTNYLTGTETVPGTAGKLGMLEMSKSTPVTVGDEVIIELFRDADHVADTCTADVDVTLVEIREV